jgi:hypothetical protein
MINPEYIYGGPLLGAIHERPHVDVRSEYSISCSNVTTLATLFSLSRCLVRSTSVSPSPSRDLVGEALIRCSTELGHFSTEAGPRRSTSYTLACATHRVHISKQILMDMCHRTRDQVSRCSWHIERQLLIRPWESREKNFDNAATACWRDNSLAWRSYQWFVKTRTDKMSQFP